MAKKQVIIRQLLKIFNNINHDFIFIMFLEFPFIHYFGAIHLISKIFTSLLAFCWYQHALIVIYLLVKRSLQK